jgi:hypothetical protein
MNLMTELFLVFGAAHFMAPLLAVSRIWYCLPLVVSISLVYGASRHEQMGPILEHALRFGAWVVTFMLAIFALLMFVSWWV